MLPPSILWADWSNVDAESAQLCEELRMVGVLEGVPAECPRPFDVGGEVVDKQALLRRAAGQRLAMLEEPPVRLAETSSSSTASG